MHNGNECIVCGKPVFLIPVCKNCKNKHFNIDDVMSVKRCKICGKELISTKDSCLQCRENVVIKHVDFMLPMFSYRLWNKELLFMWKINGQRALSMFFADFYARALHKLNVDVIVPVPPRPDKIRKNGWDQIKEISDILEYKYGFKVLRILCRFTLEQQKKLNREERLCTIGKSYSIVNEKNKIKALKPFHGHFPEKLCIIDDVCTTGATLESCGEILKLQGVEYVGAITLFMVD